MEHSPVAFTSVPEISQVAFSVELSQTVMATVFPVTPVISNKES